jgi:hypothetical protein
VRLPLQNALLPALREDFEISILKVSQKTAVLSKTRDLFDSTMERQVAHALQRSNL